VGVVLMVTTLTVGGIVEARLWQADAPWLDSVRAARPFWLHRSLSAVPIAAGFIALLLGLTTGPRGAGLRIVDQSIGVEPVREVSPRLVTAGGEAS
jgi:hypothetical protein